MIHSPCPRIGAKVKCNTRCENPIASQVFHKQAGPYPPQMGVL